MDAVIKVGGSLSNTPKALSRLCIELADLAKKHSLVVVPGGGKFADAVRVLDDKLNLSPRISHKMAILAMDQYGMLLSKLIPACCATDSLKETEKISKQGKVVVFLPSKILFQEEPFAPSWDVTSDSITIYISKKLGASKSILVTDVDGIFTNDPKKDPDAGLQKTISVNELLKLGKRTSVDRFFPEFLKGIRLDCYVVNGRFPNRIKKILLSQQAICTRILS